MVSIAANQEKFEYFPAATGPPPAQNTPSAHAAATPAAAAAATAAAGARSTAAEEVANVLAGRGGEEAVDKRVGRRIQGRQALQEANLIMRSPKRSFGGSPWSPWLC